MIFTCLSVFVSIVNSKTREEGRSEEATAKLLILIPVAKFIHEISFLFHVQRISRIQITLFSFSYEISTRDTIFSFSPSITFPGLRRFASFLCRACIKSLSFEMKKKNVPKCAKHHG